MGSQPVSGSVTVAATTPYVVRVEPALDLGLAVSSVLLAGTCVLLTDSNVGRLYASSVAQVLERARWNPIDVVTVPAGESSKSLSAYESVVRRLTRAGPFCSAS